jgi:hypothetical protein
MHEQGAPSKRTFSHHIHAQPLMCKYPTQYAKHLADGTARTLGYSPFAAAASVDAATITSSLSHKPHRIQISQIPLNRLASARTCPHFRMKTFSLASRLNAKSYCTHPASSHHYIITQIPRIPLDHHRAARDHADGPRPNAIISDV